MPSSRITVVSTRKFVRGYYMDVAFDAEDALAAEGGVRVAQPDYERRLYWLKRNRLARWLDSKFPDLSPDVFAGLGKELFFVLMWPDKRTYATMRDPRKRKWLYIFDCWEPQWKDLKSEMQGWRNIGAVYFSSSQAAEHFRSIMPFPIRWCPQAAKPCFRDDDAAAASRRNSQERIVLNIGRPNATLSRFFEDFCERHNMRFIVQKEMENVLFEDKDTFLQALENSLIVVVHPRNIDHPEITGCVSMLTARYFEAYQSGGVVCGFKPESGEFEAVLGDVPFVEYLKGDRFERDLLVALDKPEQWAAARRKVRREHSWAARARRMLSDVNTVLEQG